MSAENFRRLLERRITSREYVRSLERDIARQNVEHLPNGYWQATALGHTKSNFHDEEDAYAWIDFMLRTPLT
jgi:hypothetical protein